jgi:hypothetical protein
LNPNANNFYLGQSFFPLLDQWGLVLSYVSSILQRPVAAGLCLIVVAVPLIFVPAFYTFLGESFAGRLWKS